MTDLLDDRIRSLMVQVVEASPPADEIEAMMEMHLSAPQIAPLRPRSMRAPLRSWLVVAGAAAAVLIVGVALGVAGTWLLSSKAPPIGSSSSLTWSRVPHDDSVFGGPSEQSVSDVTVGGPGLVAVGTSGPVDATDAAVWTSADGIAWSRVPHNEEIFFGDTGAGMSSITVGGPGLVAVGWQGPHYDRSAAVWTSPDGITWSRVPHSEAVFGRGTMSSVTVGGPGLVAVGFDGDPQTAIHNAVVWTSPDGITWSRVPHNEEVFGGETGVAMGSVTAGGPGLVAVGTQWRSADSSAEVWTSPDGITWSRVPDKDALFAGAAMGDVIRAGPGLVAVGTADDDAAVWNSPDGIDWTRVPHSEDIFGGEAEHYLNGVVVGGPGLVAVGGFTFGRGDRTTVVWTSPDGIAWSRVPHNEAVFGGRPDGGISSVTAGGPGLVAVGETGSESDFDAAVWIATVDD